MLLSSSFIFIVNSDGHKAKDKMQYMIVFVSRQTKFDIFCLEFEFINETL